MATQVNDWIADALRGSDGWVDEELLGAMWCELRVNCNMPTSIRPSSLVSALDSVTDPLEVIDWLLHRGAGDARALGGLLDMGGSAWAVGTRQGGPGLQRRVHPAVEMALDSLGDPGLPSDNLRGAWEALYGYGPDPERAYARAVKAIEDAVCPRVEPNNSRRTLGSSLAALRDQKGWEIALGSAEVSVRGASAIREVCDVVWKAQQRHGGTGGVREVPFEEAKVAVHTALLVTTLFDDGLVRRSGQVDG